MPKLTKPNKKAVKKNKFSSAKKKRIKIPSLYSQLRKQARQEEKFLFLRELNPRINWEQSQAARVSFNQSQEINKRTNLALRELAQLRESRIKGYQEKTSWSLRKQRARIRKVRGRIDEEVYQKKLTERAGFQEKLGNYKGKLAREQFWSKKFQANPISLAQAELIKLRIQPEQQPTNWEEAEIFAFKNRYKGVPDEAFAQPWLGYRQRKNVQFSSIFSGSPRLKREESEHEPLIDDRLKEYQYKFNFYQLFGRPPRTEKEIRKFASINWEQEKKHYELLWKIKRRGYEKLNMPLLPWGEKNRWHMTQKQILQEGSLNAWWKQAGEEELALTITRLHKLDPQTKFWATLSKRWNDPEFRLSLLPKTHPRYRPYIYEKSENYQLDQTNKQYLSKELWRKGIKIASKKWVDYLQKSQEQLQSEGINSYLHLNGLYSSFILSKCSIHCQCNVISGTEYYETESSLPWCETCRIFNTTTNFVFADKNGHPPLAPGQCPYINSSQWGREEYSKPHRWVQCGNLMPKRGETWHHDFDAWHKGTRGWGCHLGFPQVASKKQKSRSTIVEMEW